MTWKYCMAQFGQEGEQIRLDICAGYCTYENWGIQAFLAGDTKAVFPNVLPPTAALGISMEE